MSFQIGTTARYIAADPTQQKTITNLLGGTIYYKATSDVDAEDTAVTKGNSVTITAGQYFISASTSKILIEDVPAPAFGQDVSVGDDLTVKDTLTVTGATTLTGAVTTTGGIAPASAPVGIQTWQPPTAESGTDTAFAEKKLFTASVWVPANVTLTGVKYLLGAGGGTNKVIAALFDSAGKKVANSSEATEGTVAGTEKTVQTLAFTATYAAKGPARYFIGLTANGATAKLRTIPANTALGNVLTAEISLAEKNVVPASVTAPTEWIAAKGPVAGLY